MNAARRVEVEVDPYRPPIRAGEKETLNAFLDYQRGVIVWKLEGLSEADARRPIVASGTSLLGLVRHLAYVERWWFQSQFLGEELEMPWTEEDPDGDFHAGPDETVASVCSLYREQCARSREIVAAADLDQEAFNHWGDPPHEVTLRWILVHLIEETARHLGHADILRELIDGATGDRSRG